jgi:predicted kinase
MKPLLILVSGLPCTGKTTLARNIARQLALPLISRDDLKELLFDCLGWSDRARSKQLGMASYKLLYYFLNTQVNVGNSLIIESNFLPQFDNAKLLELKKKYNFYLLEIVCYTERQILLERFKNRTESEERHPGHVERLNYQEFENTLSQNFDLKLEASDRILTIDTTDFHQIDDRELFAAIADFRK